MKITRYILCLPVLLLFFISPRTALGAKITIEDVRHKSYSGYSRVVVDLNSTPKFIQKRIKSPDRLYLDFEGSTVGGNVSKTLDIRDELLKGIRVSQFKNDTVRIVLDLGRVKNFRVFQLSGPSRVVIDIFGSRPKFNTRRVVIDAGHGGKDPGAIGYGGIREKDIVLDLARRLKKLLEKEKGFEVFLTRSDDRYLSLEKRTMIANSRNADLFISIHLNANRNKSVKGLETYTLNWTNNAEAMKVAARENKISYRRMRQSRSELGVILASLQLQNKRDESLSLANNIQRSMVYSVRNRYRKVSDLGVKQGFFYVLLGADMASVLVETAFVSNREDAGRLKQKKYRDCLARGMASGVKAYFTKQKPVHRLAQIH
jgi:N-acetylmuramoyl-L-alanine amidase